MDGAQVLICKEHTMQRFYLCRGPNGWRRRFTKPHTQGSCRSDKEACPGYRISVETLDNAVLSHIAEHVFTEERDGSSALAAGGELLKASPSVEPMACMAATVSSSSCSLCLRVAFLSSMHQVLPDGVATPCRRYDLDHVLAIDLRRDASLLFESLSRLRVRSGT